MLNNTFPNTLLLIIISSGFIPVNILSILLINVAILLPLLGPINSINPSILSIASSILSSKFSIVNNEVIP